MSDGYSITMQRAPSITDAERRARLGRVYSFLLSLASNKTADRDSLDSEPRTAACDAHAEARDACESLSR